MAAAAHEYHDWKSQGNLQKNNARLQPIFKQPTPIAPRSGPTGHATQRFPAHINPGRDLSARPSRKVQTMTIIGHLLARKARQFHPRHAIVMTLAAGAVLIAAAASSTTPVATPSSARNAAAPAIEARAPEAYVPVQSLGYVVFDWSEADGLVPGFGPLPSNGHSIGAQ